MLAVEKICANEKKSFSCWLKKSYLKNQIDEIDHNLSKHKVKAFFKKFKAEVIL